ncbi:MAG: T9SS type A sorting domain-containing protein [Candidatus Cloacimonetes bacterium]|nr:T9SS type A sorting domain-containing protein [Candidatus Cloacimonadota bacterium]
MRKLNFLFVILLFSILLQSQVPSDFVPGLRELTDTDWEFLNSLPRMELSNIKHSRELPLSLDNSQQIWFRPVFNQDGGSCGQASGIGYTFTYEIDRLRNLAANTEATQYPDHYTWNYLNGGVAGGSWHFDGWLIVQAGGCPTIETYGGIFALGQSGWMNGYDNYRSAMENRVDEIFAIDVSNPEGLETLKYWFYEHGNEEDSGGLVCFAAGVSDLQLQELPEGTPHAGELLISDFTNPVNHAITFVGFDDEIRYDYNGDGEFTNDVDINGDDRIDMRDWEIGAIRMANSWGPGWADGGFCWVMYRTLAEPTETGGIWANIVHGIYARESYEPLLTLKTNISHDRRNTLRIYAGVSAISGAMEPEIDMLFPHFNYQGGEWNMPGNMLPGAQSLEIGLDITPLLSEIVPEAEMQWWLTIDSTDPDYNGNGTMISYSIIDEVTGEEYFCELENWGIIADWTNYFSVTAPIETDVVEIMTTELPPAYEGVEYEYQLYAENGEEPYEWAIKRNYNESSGTGEFPVVNWEALSVSNDDDGYATIELPFTFRFYGEDYDQVTFITDGSVIFSENFTYIRNEENLKNSRCITVYGTDLMAYPEFGDGYYFFEEENRILFRWTVSRFNYEGFDSDFVLALNDDNTLEFYYNTDVITASSNWVAGISNGDNLSYIFTEISGEAAIPEDQVWEYNASPFPNGINISSDGLLYGEYQAQENIEESYDLVVKVWDNMNLYDEKTLTFTGIVLAEEEKELKPVVRLQQNYPNPFYPVSETRNQGTVIGFSLENTAEISLGIYNLKGQLVNQLLKEEMTAGDHQVSWNGRNDAGVVCASGVYFYRLMSSNADLSRKLLLVK